MEVVSVVRVLIVSESPIERLRATSALLLRDDIDVVEVDGAAPGREQALTGTFDVLVVDGDLSPKGGFSMLYELRADAELAGTSSPPALIMLGREEDRWLAAWAGANATLLKPVDSFKLAAAVTALVGEPPAPAPGVDESGAELEQVAEVRSS